MSPCSPRKPTAAALGLLALLSSPTARAQAADGFVKAGACLLIPGDFGVALPDPTTARFVLGWSWQIPPHLWSDRYPDEHVHHRLVPAVDLLPHPGGASWRGRLGYRYDRDHLFGGVGVGLDNAGVNLSPEVGVKFLHLVYEPKIGVEASLHLLARAEFDPRSGRLRGATFLLGWNVL
jgi:hypothetical protein